MDIDSYNPQTGRIKGEDGVCNVVDLLGGGEPVSDTIYNIDAYRPQTGRRIGEDGKAYNIVSLIKNLLGRIENGGGGSAGRDFTLNPIKLDSEVKGVLPIENVDTSSLFDGDYNNLTNQPGIPAKTSELLNDSNFITANTVDSHDISNTAHTDIREILKRTVGIPEWDDSNYILKFKTVDNEELVIDLPLEGLAKDIDYDPLTKEIILYKQNGSEIRISISDLVDVYKGYNGVHIQTVIDSGNVIRATLKAESITEAELTTALLAKINSKADKTYVDSQDTATLTSAKDYTYSQTQIDSKNNTVLSNAKSYTDTQINTRESLIKDATAKTTLADTDTIPLSDSAASNVTKKITFGNVKNVLKTYFDSLYTTALIKLTGYSKAAAVEAITGADSVNTAIGKLEKKTDDNVASLEALANKFIEPLVWREPTFQNGWASYAAVPEYIVRYAKDSTGTVFIWGLAVPPSGIISPGQIIANIPAGFRPKYSLTFPCMAVKDANTKEPNYIAINSNGNISWGVNTSGASFAWVSINIILKAEG